VPSVTVGMQLGEAFVGEGVDLAHVNTVLGGRDGPVGTAWASALASPSPGHTPFVAVARPGVPLQPFTLFVNKATIEPGRHGEHTWGAAQAGVARGVGAAVGDGTIPASSVGELCLIVAVWVNPSAVDAEAVFANNAEATRLALARGAAGEPAIDQVLRAAADPGNPYFRP
jgi:5,6,7,8-tetrahydromethanopterin hydro-lyase